MSIRHIALDTALGPITLVAEADAISGRYFAHDWRRPARETFGRRVSETQDGLLSRARRELLEYLAGQRAAFDLPITEAADEFDRSVWALLADVPYGQTTTYGDLAARLGDRRLSHDVGQALGRNPVCVFRRCHRVVGKDGSLTGYTGGVRRKRQLLDLEAAHAEAA